LKDFPNSPTTNQVFENWTWDGAKWKGSTGVTVGDITSVTAGTGLSGGGISGDVTVSLANTAVTPGTFQGLTVDAQGRITGASNQGYLTGNQTITLSGAVSGSGATAITTTLATVPIANGGTGQTAATAAFNALAAAGGTVTGTLTDSGAGQASGVFDTSTGLGGSVILNDTGSAVGNGGAVVFAANNTWRFAAIKGYVTNAANNTQGDVLVLTRRAVTDATLAATAKFTGDGGCYNISGAWQTFSDVRLKQNITPYERGLEAIRALNPVTFEYRAATPFTSPNMPSGRVVGLIAHEVAPHMPEMCGTTTVGGEAGPQEVDTLDPGFLLYALVNACKSLSERVAELERLAALEGH
jgi:Chaperone of endosialidase